MGTNVLGAILYSGLQSELFLPSWEGNKSNGIGLSCAWS